MLGRDFVLSFNRNAYRNDTTRLRIMNDKKDQVTVTVYRASGSEVTKSNERSAIIEHHLRTTCQQTFTTGDCIVRITSVQEVRMTVLDIMDGEIFYFVIPLDKAGKEHLISTSLMYGNFTCDLITIYPATEFYFSVDSHTDVTFANKSRFCNHGKCHVPVQHENALLQLKSSKDMTGMKMTSNKPCVMSCGGVVSNGRIFTNQLPSIGMYGISYQTWPTQFQGFVSLTSRCNNTHVHVHGSSNQTIDLDHGGHTDVTVLAQEIVMISSDKPIMAIQMWSMRGVIHRLTLLPAATVNHTCADHVQPTKSPLCLCPCPNTASYSLPADLDSKLQKLRELSVNKSALSSTRRRKHSAYDGRTSAQGIGIVGVTLLCVVVIFIIVLDIPNLLEQYQAIRQNLTGNASGHFDEQCAPRFLWRRSKLIHVLKSESSAAISNADTDKGDC
ncbi:uncharacterized protein [Argopecten irradians]|uniref:uncharacterized protein n=1 Tax=Argopecten irradians TaxID=31199 RepID=UPI003712B2A4